MSRGVPGPAAIRAVELTVTYRDASEPALRRISLDVKQGELVLVMGATGSGKSTLIKSLARIVPCFQAAEVTGELELLGRRVDGCTVRDLAGTVGVIFQDFEAQLFSTNVLCEVAFAMEQLGVPPGDMPGRAASALAAVGLVGFAERDPATLSGGEKQRLAIAALLALESPILLLDEPTTDLDPVGTTQVLRVLGALRALGRAVVVAEHEMATAAVADRIVLLRRGEIVASGEPRELLPHVAHFEECGVRPHDLAKVLRDLAVPVDTGWSWSDADTQASACGAAHDALVAAGFPAVLDPAPCEAAAPGEAAGAASPGAAAGRLRVSVERVSFQYPSGARALDDVSLGVCDGEFVAVIGQNGSGKTTLAKQLSGLLAPTHGCVRLDGTDIRGIPPHRLAEAVGFVFQDPDHQLFAETAAAEVAFGPRNLGLSAREVDARTQAALEAVGLGERRDADPFLLDKGERQRLAVASVLSMRPSVLILDEPTTGLDYREQRAMMDLLRRLNVRGTAVVIITHSPWVVAEYASRAILMAERRVLWDGALRGLFARPDLLARAAFRAPYVTALAQRFGLTVLSVEELTRHLRGARC